MKRRFVYKRDYSFAYNGNINFVLKILTNAALSEGRHSILVPCFFFFPFLNACQQQLSKDGIPLARSLEREWRVLFRGKWSMVFENECTFSREYRQEMLYCGLYLKCSHAVHHCWHGEREGRSGIVSSRARTISINRCVVSGYVCSFPFFFFFFFPHRPGGGSNRTFWASRDRRWYVWNIVWSCSSPQNLCIRF